jgi:hypothetical protein
MQKQQKDASRRAAPDARERIPTAPPPQRFVRVKIHLWLDCWQNHLVS